MRKTAFIGLFIAACWSVPSFAQTRPAAAQAAPAPASPLEAPAPPKVDDPMLTPVPAAPMVIARWEEAVAHLRARSTDLRIAFEEVRRAEAQTRIALAGTLPSLNVQGSLTHYLTQPPGSFTGARATTAQGTIQLSQPLLALQTWHSIGTAEVAEDVARLSVDDTKRTIALNTANAIVGVVTAERIAELNRSGLRRALEQLVLTRTKQSLGVGTALDIVRAQQDVESARATLVSGDESLRQAREALGLALGFAKPVGVVPNVQLDTLEQSAITSCRPIDSLEKRSDVAAQTKRIEVSDRNIDNVYRQFLPTISAQSNLTGFAYDTGLAPNPTWNIQAVLNFPLWEGGARYGALRNARAVKIETEQQLEALWRNATIQIEQARRNVLVSEDARKVADSARNLAAETDRLTRISYREGTATSLELVIASAALRQAEITLALREFDLVRARILSLLTMSACTW